MRTRPCNVHLLENWGMKADRHFEDLRTSEVSVIHLQLAAGVSTCLSVHT